MQATQLSLHVPSPGHSQIPKPFPEDKDTFF
jgi:hypothetical protein